MHLTALYRNTQLPRSKASAARGFPRACLSLALCLLCLATTGANALAQEPPTTALLHHPGVDGLDVETHTIRARRFLAGRTLASSPSAAVAMAAARQQHTAMLQ